MHMQCGLQTGGRSRLVLAVLLAGCPTSGNPHVDEPCDPATESCPAPDPSKCDSFTPVGDFQLCALTGDASYTVVVKYTGAGKLALDKSDIRLDSKPFDAGASFDAATQTFSLHAESLAPSKYSFLFRLATDSGA